MRFPRLIAKLDEFLLSQRKIFLWGEVDEATTEYVIKSLRFCAAANKEDICLYIQSEGGDVECAEAIIDEIDGCIKRGINVYTVGIGRAYSAGCIILALGSPGCRFATESCSMMLHPISYEMGDDYAVQQERAAVFTTKKSEALFKRVATACGKGKGKSFNTFKSEVDKGLWLNCKDAIKNRIIDGIWNYKWEDIVYEETDQQ